VIVLVVEITLTSSNKNHLVKCKNDITELARSASSEIELKNTSDMSDWSQETVDKFYQRCLETHVKPTLDFNQLTVRLEGPKDAVIAWQSRRASFRDRIILGFECGEILLRTDHGDNERGALPCYRARSSLVRGNHSEFGYVGTVLLQTQWNH
jgi:hypothetical protein